LIDDRAWPAAARRERNMPTFNRACDVHNLSA